ncbi:uncharacterized protein LOC127702451 isoform X2 [Mytilus californianus]|uniref:uncharacterized protein LOC127702451 isoform X2 n=1 Tax=Mytilus californianus TaxID=6549 RepID=UPI002246D6C0|nr:uncharacterized protein LOC127702451 isoform X2 [Mytilus californianus]
MQDKNCKLKMIRHSSSNRDTVMSLIILTAIFFTGTVQFELDLSTNDGTIVSIGSNLTFTCSVKPCNETGSVMLLFGHAQHLFSGICNESSIKDIKDRRVQFSCDSAQCMYSLNVYDVDITDHKRSMVCTYRSSEDVLNKSTSIGVLDDTDNITTISPPGPFVDGESVDFKCCVRKIDIPNTNLSFQCHGELITQEIDKFTCLNVNVSIDIDKNSSKCTCTVQSKDMSIDLSSELDLVISQYDPLFESSSVTNVVFGNTTTIACRVPGLQYPFAFGRWKYKNGKEEKSVIGSTSSNETTLLTVNNSTYEEIGTYYCTVVDVRKNDSIVANTSTELYVQGPIILKRIHTEHVNTTLCSITITFESFPDIKIDSLWTNNRQVQFRQGTLNSFVMQEMDKLSTEQEGVINFKDCLSSNVYGLIVSNGFVSKTVYFNLTGELFNISPMLKIDGGDDGHFIDGKQASITCYDIIKSEASSLDLSCDNITNIEQEVNDDATLIKNVFTADIKNDDTICRCISNKSNSESMLTVHIFPYKGHNVSHGKDVCESNSEIKLTCQEENLPDLFHFGKWIHHYNDVEIRQMDGFSSGKQTFIQIPFCTYEDIGNYTCTVTDSRKNTTVLNSTTFLSVPGPPVIVNSSVVKHTSKAECLLSVEFYSFDEKSAVTWYKNGRVIHSSEHQRPNVKATTHSVNMHNIEVPVKAKIATLQLKPGCDVDTSIYRLTVKTNNFSTSHTFEKDGHNVSHRKDVCESNSEIKLTCQEENLPDLFHFGKWIHHYNDVEIRQMDGFSSGKQTFIQIPFCTYEDIGNYTCTVTDSRKNTTVFNSTTFLSVPGPPVIVNSSVVKHTSKAECLLSVEFYSFDEKSAVTWYKNGRLLHSSEHQRPNVKATTHSVNMHNIEVPVKAKIATLQLKPGCDVDMSIYRLTVKTEHFSTSHTFEKDGRKKKFRFNRKSLYTSNAVVGRRIDTQFYEEIDMFIENLRQGDEETTPHNRYTLTENEYEQIPFDRN